MSSGLTRSSRPHVSSVGAVTLCSWAQYGVASDASAALAPASNAALLYILRALARVSGSVACVQRSSISSSVTMAGSNTIECNHAISRSRVGSSVNSIRRLMPSPGPGLKRFLPMPPMVISLATRSGCAMANWVPTMPPIEFPSTATSSSPSPSRKRSTASPAVSIGWPPKSSLTPNPGNSRMKVRKCSAKTPRLPRKLRHPVTPGPEPCSSRRGGPSPASW
ncbi:hypothetical protein MLGJGCBP_00528 [Rhodococcus sp. T7]|nr:hypothetical protein MLGJGCBP_00528 [Rhodococcus sp. T7]